MVVEQAGSNEGKGRVITPGNVIWTLLVFVIGRQSSQYNVLGLPSSSSSVGGAEASVGSTERVKVKAEPLEEKEEEEENSLALKESYGLLNGTTNAEWHTLKEQTNAKNGWYFDSTDPLKPDINNSAEWNDRNMVPNFQCPHVERMGNPQEGESKFVCNPRRLTADAFSDPATSGAPVTATPNCLIYSFGCAGDFQFEDSLVEFVRPHKGCEIHIFDPASAFERPDDVKNKNIHYHAWGLRSSYDDDSKSVVWPKGRGGGFKTFQETLQELGHDGRTIDILSTFRFVQVEFAIFVLQCALYPRMLTSCCFVCVRVHVLILYLLHRN